MTWEEKPSCVRCHDSGWIELDGVDADGFPLGCTGCNWCAEGAARFAANPSLRKIYTTSQIMTPIWSEPPVRPGIDDRGLRPHERA